MKQKLSQEELTHRVGLYRIYIGHIEVGRYTPSVYTIYKISKSLRLKSSDLPTKQYNFPLDRIEKVNLYNIYYISRQFRPSPIYIVASAVTGFQHSLKSLITAQS